MNNAVYVPVTSVQDRLMAAAPTTREWAIPAAVN